MRFRLALALLLALSGALAGPALAQDSPRAAADKLRAELAKEAPRKSLEGDLRLTAELAVNVRGRDLDSLDQSFAGRAALKGIAASQQIAGEETVHRLGEPSS